LSGGKALRAGNLPDVSSSRSRLLNAAVGAVVLVVLGVSYLHLFYGIDLTDESFYAATTYRFVLGDTQPFVDETVIPQQTAALLMSPLVWAYYQLVGLTGIVLFLRHAQFLLSLAVALTIFVSLRPYLESRKATLVSLGAVLFVPLNIHSLSYITIGSSFFAIGCFLGLPGAGEEWSSTRRRLASGIAHAVSAVAYPPMILPILATLIARLTLARPRRRSELLGYGLPAIGIPLLGAALVTAAAGGLSPIRDDFADAANYFDQAGGIDKLLRVVQDGKSVVLLIPGILLLALVWYTKRRYVPYVGLLLPFFALPPHAYQFLLSNSLDYVAHYAWIALPLFYFLRSPQDASRNGDGRLLFLLIWLPALVAGIAAGYGSNNSSVAIGIGFFPGAIVSSVFLIWIIEDVQEMYSLTPRWMAALPPLIFIAIMLTFSVPAYRDGPLRALDVRVTEGPYAGITTTRERRNFLTQLQGDLSGLNRNCRILFFTDLPGGYLMSRAKPHTNSAWSFFRTGPELFPYQDELIRYYNRNGFPDIVVRTRLSENAVQAGLTDHYLGQPLLAMVRSPMYRIVRSRGGYVIHGKEPSSCQVPPRASS
jgi:hypothetical protein